MVTLEAILYPDIGVLLLRFAVGAVFLYHAWPKLKAPAEMAKGMGWPSWGPMVLGGVEMLGALSVILGVYTQLGALALAIVMAGATYHKVAKWKVPFSAMDKMGWEFDLILLAANLAILLGGAGAYALL